MWRLGTEPTFRENMKEALYVCDWTYGRLFAVHLNPKGASYEAELEEFITGTPLPFTDIVVNPIDKAMYFTIGGRRTQSGLYRVTWSGAKEVGTTKAADSRSALLRAERRELEKLHAVPDVDAIEKIWMSLAHDDRHIRYAARIALEHLDPKFWLERALAETDPDAAIGSLLALTRTHGSEHQQAIVESLIRLFPQTRSDRQRLDLLRTLAVTFARHGQPTEKQAALLTDKLLKAWPANSTPLKRELCRMLVYLKADGIAANAVAMMAKSVTQEDLLAYGMMLRVAENGWNEVLRRSYFSLLNKIEAGAATGDYVGGGHLQIYVQRFRKAAADRLSKNDQQLLNDVINAPLPSTVPTGSPTPRPFVKNWTIADLLPHVDRVGSGRSYENGKAMFAIANCVQCHRFKNIGGILGPDITGAAKRYSRPVMLREILEPSKQISDQFRTHLILTESGETYEGRILNRTGTELTLAADPRRPNSVVQIPADEVEAMRPSPVSMMPKDLLNTLTLEEILDLLAFIESGGDSTHAIFSK